MEAPCHSSLGPRKRRNINGLPQRQAATGSIPASGGLRLTGRWFPVQEELQFKRVQIPRKDRAPCQPALRPDLARTHPFVIPDPALFQFISVCGPACFCWPTTRAAAVDADRWMEINLYWFKEKAIPDTVHQF
jgi:hypothetical protein